MGQAAKASRSGCGQRMQPLVDGTVTVSLDQTRSAMRVIARRLEPIAEGAGGLALAAALTGQAGEGPNRLHRFRRQYRPRAKIRRARSADHGRLPARLRCRSASHAGSGCSRS
jgi:hypothetical protein